MADFIRDQGSTPAEFYAQAREFQDDGGDAKTALFLKLLLASSDYETFYDVMLQGARDLEAREVMEQRANKMGSK